MENRKKQYRHIQEKLDQLTLNLGRLKAYDDKTDDMEYLLKLYTNDARVTRDYLNKIKSRGEESFKNNIRYLEDNIDRMDETIKGILERLKDEGESVNEQG